MAVSLKCLNKGQVPTGQAAVYTVPADKAAIMKNMRFNMRFVNTGGSATINAYFRRGAGGTTYYILDVSKAIGAGGFLNYDDELCLEADDRIELAASAATIDYVLSGIERDQ